MNSSTNKNIRIEYSPTSSIHNPEQEQEKLLVLKTLSMGNDELYNLWVEKLQKYVYVSSIDTLQCGRYIRYIDRRKEIPSLSSGGILIKIDYDRHLITLMYKKAFWNVSLKMNEVFIQKSKQDYLLELFKNYLSKENS